VGKKYKKNINRLTSGYTLFVLIDAEWKDLSASVTSPSGLTEECDVSEVKPGEYCIKFVPKELGVHTVSVKHRGFHIPGSGCDYCLISFFTVRRIRSAFA